MQITTRFDTSAQPAVQVALLPYRRVGEELHVALVSKRRNPRRWDLPRSDGSGGPEGRRAAREAAAITAGLVGEVSEHPVGLFTDADPLGRPRIVQVFPMPVDKSRSLWPEMDERERIWLEVEDAASMVEAPGLALCVRRLPGVLQLDELCALAGTIAPAA